jgi:L-alanine-DL-glutamate epimerase-like enolase superfamily enzyme
MEEGRQPMKIRSLESAYLRVPLPASEDGGHGAIDTEELVLVTVRTDGADGFGYAYTIGKGGRAIRSLIDHELTDLLVGRTFGTPQEAWRHMWQRTLYIGRGGLTTFAIAAIDIALWDAFAKNAGSPLYRALGAEARDLPTYGSGVDLHKPLDDLLAQVDGYLQRGLRGVKMKVGRPSIEDDIARVRAVREMIGPDIALMVDANMAWDREQALDAARHLQEFDLRWLEEPLPPEDVEGHSWLRKQTKIPLSVGESFHSPAEFTTYTKAAANDVFQVDPVTNGGVSVVIEAIARANEAGLDTSTHYADELNAHLLCMADKPVFLEKHAFALDDLLEQPQFVFAGLVRPTDEAGHGIRFRADAVERFSSE